MDKGITLLQASLLFTLFLAVSVGVFFSLYQSRVTEARFGMEVQQLLDMLVSRASAANLGSVVPVDLPSTVGGEKYVVECKENEFVLFLQTGKMSGNKFSAVSPVRMVPRLLQAGVRVYFCPTASGIVILDYPLSENIEKSLPPSENPPQFYFFSKDNPETAACVLGCYFWLGKEPKRYFERILEIENLYFEFLGESEGSAWIVREMRPASPPSTMQNLPSVEEAENSGWLISPTQALDEAKERRWKDFENREIRAPENVLILPCVVFTRIGRFVAWRIAWENYILYIRALPWWWKENSPGFVWWSSNLTLG